MGRRPYRSLANGSALSSRTIGEQSAFAVITFSHEPLVASGRLPCVQKHAARGAVLASGQMPLNALATAVQQVSCPGSQGVCVILRSEHGSLRIGF